MHASLCHNSLDSLIISNVSVQGWVGDGAYKSGKSAYAKHVEGYQFSALGVREDICNRRKSHPVAERVDSNGCRQVASTQEDECGIGAKSWACEQELEGHLQAGQLKLANWHTPAAAERKCVSKASKFGPFKHGHRIPLSLQVDAGDGRLVCQAAAAH